jgi:hypothetical protein
MGRPDFRRENARREVKYARVEYPLEERVLSFCPP